jgi:uncharacterized protein (DUF849 family)
MAMLQVTPNGRYGKDVHPRMPVAVQELIEDLRSCFEAGARGVHLHPRDGQGNESLRPLDVNQTVRAVRELADQCGVQVEIGPTTGAWIVPELQARIGMISAWQDVDCATVNLSEDGYEHVMQALRSSGIGIDVGLRDRSEIDRLACSGFFPHVQRVSIELDPGEPYFPSGDPVVLSRQLSDALDSIGCAAPRLTHGAGTWTWPLVQDALRRGHDTRVGFEDSVVLPDGSVATSNADLVRAALSLS